MIRSRKLSLVGLVETKVKEVNKDCVVRAINPTWCVLSNYHSSPLGRVWVLWDPSVLDVVLVTCSAQAIHVRVTSIEKGWSCVVSVLYGDNELVHRADLWADLVSRHVGFDSLPWLVMGDLNSTRLPTEALGGSTDWPAWQNDLGVCLACVGLEDLANSGCFYTWSNKRAGAPIVKKLDRVLVNLQWECSFTGSSTEFLPAGIFGPFSYGGYL